MLVLPFLLLAQQAENLVRIEPTGKDSYMLTLVTGEDAATAVALIKAAAVEACKATRVKSEGPIFLGTIRGSKKKGVPDHAQILRPINCEPAPAQ